MKLRTEFRVIKKVALLLRVSTQQQVVGNSLDTQEKVLREWAAREGWEVGATYEDAGKSAYRKVAGRDAFLQMIEDAEAGKFDAVLVLKGDRWMRGVRYSTEFRERLFAVGVQYKSLEEPGAWDGSLGGFLQGNIADTFAEYYSLDLSIKKTRNLRTHAENGLTLGDVPFGHRRDDPRQPIYPDPEQALAVRRMFERYATGLVSMDELADDLNSQGFRPRSKRGKIRFSKASVVGMLKNPVNVGFVTRYGELIRVGLHEAIVPEELFDRVQLMIRQRAGKPRANAAQPPRPNLLSGIGFCVTCGNPLWANSALHGRLCYYRCSSRQRGGVCDDRSIGVRAEELEARIGLMFESMELPKAWQERVRLLTQEDQPDDLDQQRRYWEREIGRAKAGYKAGVLDVDEAAEMRRTAEAHLADLRPIAAERAIESGATLTNMREIWPRLTADERREAVRITLAAVGVDLRRGEIKAVQPRTDFAPLFQAVSEDEGGVVQFCDWRPRSASGALTNRCSFRLRAAEGLHSDAVAVPVRGD